MTASDPSSRRGPGKGEPPARWALALARVSGVGPVTARALVRHFGSPRMVFEATESALLQVEGVGPQLAHAIRSFRDWSGVERTLALAGRHGMNLLVLGQPEYPPLLGEISDPPVCLYCKGALIAEDDAAVALVGARRATREGVRAAADLAAGLARHGVTVVSGMARGIDTAAHRAALDAGGRTAAVLGCGLDVVYPAENVRLYREVAERGALLAEFDPGTKPDAGNFPIRNRIISGLSRGIIVVEAEEKSGSLITAQRALDQGREVFAVPGNIYSRGSKGTNRLIQQGAKLVQKVEDVLEELWPERLAGAGGTAGVVPPVSDEEGRVLDLLREESVHVDPLIQRSGLSPSRVLQVLLQLELKGLVRQFPGQRFARAG